VEEFFVFRKSAGFLVLVQKPGHARTHRLRFAANFGVFLKNKERLSNKIKVVILTVDLFRKNIGFLSRGPRFLRRSPFQVNFGQEQV
jgi:hypothetical protein